jgi:hypothetical protein
VGADESWYQAVTGDLARAEYAATRTPAGLQAPNRAQNLRTAFGEHGIEVVPRTGNDVAPAWRFAWKTIGMGRQGRMEEVGVASPESEGARVTYRREGWSEWYENTAKGLEQGFTIERRPAGEGPLHIAGKVPGALEARARADGAIDFIDDHGACAIRYGELHVWDARGVELSSELEVAEATLSIVIDDRGATYPLTIDPLMTSPAWTAESDQASALFGFSVSTAGDVNGDGFSDVIVGAWLYDNGQTDEGRAFVYHGSASGLSVTANWTGESDQAGTQFGVSVATAGDVNGDGFSDVIVGANFYDNVEADEGRAFVYHGSASGLSVTANWTAESNQVGGQFGFSVATAGDVNGDGFSDVIVGAWVYASGQANEGRAFVYHGSASGVSVTANWTAESNQANAFFGVSVAGAGDVNGDGFADVIVGADSFTNGQSAEGRAFVYQGSAGGLAASPAWTAEPDQGDSAFGHSVATAGDVNGDGFSDVIVGAHNLTNGQSTEGRAFVYQGSATGLATTPAWTAEGNQASANFGHSVATAGDVNGDGFSDVIVGAWLYDNGQSEEGRALVYHGSAASLATTAAWNAESDQAFASGYSVATAGDVNGDGYSDVIVGAGAYDNGETNEGRAFLYLGAPGGLAAVPAWTAEGNQADASFGISTGTAGDVNGDGYSDVIVGAVFYDHGETNEGRAFVYHGSAAGLSTIAAWTEESDQVGALFGGSVATAGDVNGDAFSDVIVGAWDYDNGEVTEGRAFVYHGSAAGLGLTPAWTAESNQVFAAFGIAVATAGDVNGDGFSDVVVGAFWYDNGETDEGRAFVYEGSAAGLAPSPAWTAEGDQASALFGTSVATAGDVNGDGFSDVIVGALRYDNGENDEGRAFLYQGSAGGLGGTPVWRAEGDQAIVEFGNPVGTAGDVNGDGFSDVIIGAYQYSNGESGEGRAFVYHGSAGGLSTTAAWTAEGNQVLAHFGTSVATAGDVNGDGFSDVIVGADSYDNGEPNEGRAFVYYGNGGPGRTTLLRQQRTDGTTPIALLGRSDSDTQFRIRAIMPSIYGRTRLQMEHEVKPLGALFDGLSTVAGGYVDVGADGEVEMNQLVSALSPDTPYHWRVRAKYDLVKSPFQRNGPWMHIPLNGWNEADLRTADAQTGIEMAEAPRAPVFLEAPRPNPFGTTAAIGYTLPRSGHVRLTIYDAAGRARMVLMDAVKPAGRQVATWNGRDARGAELPAGVYFARLAFDGRVETQKLVIAP